MLDWQGWVTIAVYLIVFYALIREYWRPGLTLLGGAAVFLLCGIISPAEFLAGFSEGIVFTLAMLYIVARALESTGILSYLAQKVLPKKSRGALQLAQMMVPVSTASAFLNNTPIVLMLTSGIRRWALEQKLPPSRFLIPISYAAIFGGMCTLIGTAPNLIVNGLVQVENSAGRFGFFEFAYVGLPLAVVGTLYMIFIGRRLLPDRREPVATAEAELREFTAEFLIEGGCVWADKQVADLPEWLIEVQRDGEIFASPSQELKVHVGDRLVFVADLEAIARLRAVKGLRPLDDPQFTLDPKSSHVAEVVVAVGSWLVGRTVKQVAFRARYGASVVGVYRQGERVSGPVGDILLHPGDTLILIANYPWQPDRRTMRDFYPIRQAEELPVFVPLRALWSLSVLTGMVVAVVLRVPILYASLAAAGLLLVTRVVRLRQAARGIDWSLLLLVAAAFPVGSALLKTGVAALFARGILAVVGQQPNLLIGGIFFATAVVTELVTNAVAVLMVFPLAYEAMHLAGYTSLVSLKAVGITVAIAASCSLLTPIGYQTNTIVYGPGGYRFGDYARVGTPLVIALWLLSSYLIPTFWPLS